MPSCMIEFLSLTPMNSLELISSKFRLRVLMRSSLKLILHTGTLLHEIYQRINPPMGPLGQLASNSLPNFPASKWLLWRNSSVAGQILSPRLQLGLDQRGQIGKHTKHGFVGVCRLSL